MKKQSFFVIAPFYGQPPGTLRYATSRVDKHPGIKRFVESAQHCVDIFHYVHNHVDRQAWDV